eukprot:3195966-Karenia_brevis.AAC.1
MHAQLPGFRFAPGRTQELATAAMHRQYSLDAIADLASCSTISALKRWCPQLGLGPSGAVVRGDAIVGAFRLHGQCQRSHLSLQDRWRVAASGAVVRQDATAEAFALM